MAVIQFLSLATFSCNLFQQISIKPDSIQLCSLTVSAWTEPQLSPACLNYIAINGSLDFCFFNLFKAQLSLNKFPLLFLIKCHSLLPLFLHYLFIAANKNLPEVSFCDKKFLQMPRNFFLGQEISASDNKFILVTRNLFLSQEIYSCDKKLLPLIKDSFL